MATTVRKTRAAARPEGTSTPAPANDSGRVRDPVATQARILAAAKAEFARKGLAGGRVDEIADRAKINKRMIYHYFSSKDQLFLAVLEAAYEDIRSKERALKLEGDMLRSLERMDADLAELRSEVERLRGLLLRSARRVE